MATSPSPQDSDSDSLTDLSDIDTPPPPSPPLAHNHKAKPAKPNTLAALMNNARNAKSKPQPQPQPKKQEPPAKSKTKQKQNQSGKHTPTHTDKSKSKSKIKNTPHSTVSEHGVTGTVCHHHRANCSGPLLECTMLKSTKRCHGRYCYKVLRRLYNMDPDTIVRTGRSLVDQSQHCPSDEAKYAWKCPRCRGKCQCSDCRRRKGLPPLSEVANTKAAPAPLPATPTTSAGAGASSSPKNKTKVQVHVPPPRPRIVKPPPTPVPPPDLQTIPTLLGPENLRARFWLYESFVRLDKIGLPRNLLSGLDKFDAWTPAQLHEMLATLLRFIAGLSHIEKGQASRLASRAVAAYRAHANDLTRGEPWSAAREMLDRLAIPIRPLPFVDHPVQLFLPPSPSPPPIKREMRSRTTRVDYAAQLAALDGISDDDDHDHDEMDARPSRRAKRRRIANDDDDDDDDHDHDPRSRSPAPSDTEQQQQQQRPTLTARQQAAALAKEHALAQAEAEGSINHGGNDGDNDDKDDDDDSLSDKPAEPAAPEDAPDLETRVSILCSLIDATLSNVAIADELKRAPDEIAALEKRLKSSVAELDKDAADQLATLNKRAPSLVHPRFAAWKEEKAALEADIRWRKMDLRVVHAIAVDAHALRTGPIGVDPEGREYWHLREYQDRMPKNTEGRYSWSLLVLGTPFPPQAEDATLNADEAEAEAGQQTAPKATATAKDTDTVLMGTNDVTQLTQLIQYVRYLQAKADHPRRQREADRARTDALLARLHATREYFAWHQEQGIPDC